MANFSRTFRASPESLRRKQIIFLTLPVVALVISILFFAVSGEFQVNRLRQEFKFVAPVLIVVLAIVGLTVWLQGRAFLNRARETVVRVGEEGFERECDGEAESIAFVDITRVLILRLRDGTPISVRVVAEGRTVALAGFEKLDELAALFLTAVAGRCETRTIKVDWSEPRYVFMCLGFIAAACFVVNLFGSEAASALELLNVPAGAWLLFFRPITKATGPRSRPAEIAIGTLLVVIPLLHNALQLNN